MILDAHTSFSNGQALTGSAASTDSIDFSAIREIGVGEQLYILVNVPVAAGGTTPTLSVGLQVDDNSAFSSPATLFTSPVYAAAALTAGAQFVYPLPVTGMERHARLNYTMTGTSPTITLDAHLVTGAQLARIYPSGYAIQ